MASLVQWKADAAEALKQALTQLRAGQVVGFPSDSVYHLAACALYPKAVEQLRSLCPHGTLTLALAFSSEVFDWLPTLRGAGLRVARRLWPGACVLRTRPCPTGSLLNALPESVRTLLLDDNLLSVTTPNHLSLRQVAYHLAAPLVIAAPAPGIRTAAQLAQAAPDAALILDGGEATDSRPPTIVRVEGKSVQVERDGMLGAGQIEDVLPCRIVFLCTGNTCRSPMAQALCVQMLADWIGCAPQSLPRHGYVVESAGLAAVAGEPASPDGVVIVDRMGADLSRHRSQALSYETLANADFIFAMTHSHLRLLKDLQVDVGPQPRLLSRAGDDVADPIGGPPEIYEECARQIHAYLRDLLPELQENA